MSAGVLESQVYDVLVALAGATDDESNRAQFHHFWPERDDYREYRFIGALGFGGKLFVGRAEWWVSCYPEHRTPEREAIIATTNLALASLRAECGAASRPAADTGGDET